MIEKIRLSETEQTQLDLAIKLEKAGYKNALNLIKKELVPIAEREKIPLIEAAWKYANGEEDQDTSFFQLFEALQNI